MDNNAVMSWNVVKSLCKDQGVRVSIELADRDEVEVWIIYVDGMQFVHKDIDRAITAAGDWARGRKQ